MSIAKKLIVPGAIVASGFIGVGGASMLTSLQAHAATATTGTSSAATDPVDSATEQKDPSEGGHTANGVTEALLTGDAAAKAKAAAEAAVPGGTVLRIENDAEGATYEAHIKKSDGSQVTVKMDTSFKVTGTEAGGPNHDSQTSDDSAD